MPPMHFDYFVTLNGEQIFSSEDERKAQNFYTLLVNGRTSNVKTAQLVCRCTYKKGTSTHVKEEFKRYE